MLFGVAPAISACLQKSHVQVAQPSKAALLAKLVAQHISWFTCGILDASASMIRVQTVVHEGSNALYDDVVTKGYAGKFHEFCNASGMRTFLYLEGDLEAHPLLTEIAVVSERRLTTCANHDATTAADELLGERFLQEQPRLFASVAHVVAQAPLRGPLSGHDISMLVTQVLDMVPLARCVSKTLIRRLVVNGAYAEKNASKIALTQQAKPPAQALKPLGDPREHLSASSAQQSHGGPSRRRRPARAVRDLLG